MEGDPEWNWYIERGETQFSTVKWTRGRQAFLSKTVVGPEKITISERIGLLNGSQKSINEADKVVATTLRLLTCLSTLERLLIFQFNRRYFSIIILGKDNPWTILPFPLRSIYDDCSLDSNIRPKINTAIPGMNCVKHQLHTRINRRLLPIQLPGFLLQGRDGDIWRKRRETGSESRSRLIYFLLKGITNRSS